MNLIEELRKFDGKHTAPLEKISKELIHHKGKIPELIVFAQHEDTKIQSAATWLIKHLNEESVKFSQPQTTALINLLGNLSHWEAKLHILQILSNLNIPANQYDVLHKDLRQTIQSENKLLRAWAYNGLAILADQNSELRTDVCKTLNRAQTDSAASVRARIRNLSKSFEWLQ